MIAIQSHPAISASKQDLVLIHAFPLTGTMYNEAVRQLQSALPDLAVHVVDLPGFGDAPYREQWTLKEAMQSLHDLLHKKSIAAPVIGGTSMGGYAALAYYRLYPKEVLALLLSNTKAAADTEKAKSDREVFAKDVEARGHEAVYERMLDKLITIDRGEMREQLKGSIAKSDPRSIAAALRTLAVREDSIDLLATIECPALIISGSKDTIMTPDDTKQLQTIRDSHSVVLTGTAHLPVVEQPDTWAAEVAKFLSTIEGSPI